MSTWNFFDVCIDWVTENYKFQHRFANIRKIDSREVEVDGGNLAVDLTKFCKDIAIICRILKIQQNCGY